MRADRQAAGRQRRILVFGGSFDPVHNGHRALARAACREFSFDRVIFLPARIPPHKNRVCSSVRHRLSMLRCAVGSIREFSISRYEAEQPGTTYTKDSLRYFRTRFPRAEIAFLIGGDSLKEIKSWAGGMRLCAQYTCVVGRRPGVVIPKDIMQSARRLLVLKERMPAVSSTGIREKVCRGQRIRGLVPAAVERYIRCNGLYRL